MKVTMVIMDVFLVGILIIGGFLTYRFMNITNTDYIYLLEDAAPYTLFNNSKTKYSAIHIRNSASANIASPTSYLSQKNTDRFYAHVHMTTDQALSTILNIVFILVAIVLGAQIYTFGSLRKEYADIATIKENYEKEVNQDKIQLAIVNILADARYAIHSNRRSAAQNAKEKIYRFWEKYPDLKSNADIILLLDNIYGIEGNHDKSIDLLSDYINEYVKKLGPTTKDDPMLADLYYNRACSYYRKYISTQDDKEKIKLKKAMLDDIKNKILCDPYTTLEEFKDDDDKDFKTIIKDAEFTSLFKKKSKLIT